MTQLINASVVDSDIATQAELDVVVSTVAGINKAYVGLGNVDNTSDVDKPISTLTTTALSGKQATLVSATNIKTINGVSILGSGDLVVSGGGGGGGLTGFRNRIINGDMRIDQRNNGVAVTPTGSVFLLDRWSVALAAASKLTFQQVVDAPAGTKNSLKVTVAAQYAPSVSNQFAVLTKIEGVDVTDMQLGLATAATITTSLWVKGSVAGTYSCFLTNAASNRSYIGTIAVTTSWVRQSVVLTCDTAGAWATDNTTGLTFGIDLGSGSGLNGTAGAWAGSFLTRTSGSVTFVNQVAGSTLNITGVQLELGSTATPFEFRPYSVELALCQRYYFRYSASDTSASEGTLGVGFAQSPTAGRALINFPVKMRTTPTSLEQSGTATDYRVILGSLGSTVCSAVPIFSNASAFSGDVSWTVASVATTNQPAFFNFNASGGYLGWSAEL